jgi:hypothetical protein
MVDRTPVAFIGPCLSGPLCNEVREACSGFRIEPPARRGDVLRVLAGRPEAILLLDGYYYTTPSVSHKEILYALAAGVRVAGASSMGALRAAELAPWGMEGIGRVATWFLEGRLDGDDEVALLHAPSDAGYRILTLALVEVRHALSALDDAPVASRTEPFLSELKTLAFDKRDEGRVREAAERHFGIDPARLLMAALNRDSVKQRDAIKALQALRTSPRGKRPQAVAVASTGYLNTYKELYLAAETGSPPLGEAWNMARVFHPAIEEFVRARRIRFLLSSAWDELTADIPEQEVDLWMERLQGGSQAQAGLPWPETELRQEALLEAKAERALGWFGSEDAALRFLAGQVGLGESVPRLLSILDRQEEHLPTWYLVRTFALTPAFGPASALASIAGRVGQAFARWAHGRRIARMDLRKLAAELWNCPDAEIERVASRRGLPVDGGNSPGLWGAMAAVAPVERLPSPPSGYEEAKAALRKATVRVPIEPPCHGPSEKRSRA